jgi:hypothetical protein
MARNALFLAAIASSLALPIHAQVRRAPAQPGTTPVEIALQVGARKYEASGPGECKAAPQAAIYGVRAAMYSATFNAEGRSVRLTLWRPADGAANMMQLEVADGPRRESVDTVKGGTKKETRGSGTATFQAAGEGGAFSVDAVSAGGVKIRGSIRCGRLGAVRAEGG